MTPFNNTLLALSPDDEPTEPIIPTTKPVKHSSILFSQRQMHFPVRNDAYKRGMILLLLMAVMALQVAIPVSPHAAGGMGATVAVAPLAAEQHRQMLEALAIDQNALMAQINPAGGQTLSAKFGNLGPRLLAMGAIDVGTFRQVYQRAGQPLTNTQAAILVVGSGTPVVVDSTNAYFLLNFFWSVGLTNHNPILTRLAAQYGIGGVSNFASTGGWSLGARQPMELYNSEALIPLNPEQQTRLEAVTSGVFRPCCGNHTAFPDCNHGMAMLGLLELMASQGATVDEMFLTAKSVNAYWFPQQALEVAMFLKAAQNVDFASADPRAVVGEEYFSAPGFKAVHQWLTAHNLLPKSASGGNSCGVR